MSLTYDYQKNCRKIVEELLKKILLWKFSYALDGDVGKALRELDNFMQSQNDYSQKQGNPKWRI